MKWLVFSRNRPLQLDAFLRSAKENAGIDEKDVSVLHRYDAEYSESLEILKSEHPSCEFIEESRFREQTVEWIERAPDVISFATDDAMFTREVKSDFVREILLQNPSILTVSLRLGLHLNWCYPTNQQQIVPNGQVVSQLFVWETSSADGDWGYPLSVDGHVYRKKEILELLKLIPFNNPNELEANLQSLKKVVQSTACCFLNSSYFNIPLNRVQETYKNRCGTVNASELMRSYISGKRISSDKVRGLLNTSAHQEILIDGYLL